MVKVGHDIKLFVHYDGGYPTPDVTWKHSVQGVLQDIHHSRATFSRLLQLNLTINNSQLEDDGLYILRVNNSVDERQLEFNVSILGENVFV